VNNDMNSTAKSGKGKKGKKGKGKKKKVSDNLSAVADEDFEWTKPLL